MTEERRVIFTQRNGGTEVNRGCLIPVGCEASGAARFARGWVERYSRIQAPVDHVVFVFVSTSRPMHRPQAGAPTRTRRA
jgi:hypothetical protein